jgi:four helix bundle protein
MRVNEGLLGLIKVRKRENMEPIGFRKLIVWQNAYKLRKLVYDTSARFPKSELRRVSQMRDAARSVKQNIQEGYGRTLREYMHYLGIAKGSLRELSGDIEDCRDDGLITQDEFAIFNELLCKTDYLFVRLLQSLRKIKTS